jgi:Ala-tRNA(Pro) deacylase
MPVRKLKEFLDTNGVKYVTIGHSRAFTAQEIAESAHIKGKHLAKAVIVRLDDTPAMAVVPGDAKVDLDRLREIANAKHVELASESEFRGLFPDCEIGAMPPFGNLFDMPVYVDGLLAQDEEIAFNAGSHVELMRLRYEDFERLVEPTVVSIALRARSHKP